MAGNPPEYDDDHPPPQWPRFYRPAEKGPEEEREPATVPGALGLDAANQELDHLGKIGLKVPLEFSERVTPISGHTMSEFKPEKHIYIVQFTWGWPEQITVDDADIEFWDAWIALQNRIRAQMLREFNVHIWIHYVVYPVMVFSPTDFQGDTPAGGPWHRWKTWGFVPVTREDTDLDLPSWCSVNNNIVERNLNESDISAAIFAVQALGGPGLTQGRTGLGLVNSYPTFNVGLNIGLFASTRLIGGPNETPEGQILQTFVEDRNDALISFIGQDDIEQADSRPVVVDFTARGSGTDQSLLDLDVEFYQQQNRQVNEQPFNSSLQDWHGNGPNHPEFFPFPHPKANLYFYLCEEFALGGYAGRDGSGWMGGTTVRYFAREGFFEDVDREMDPSDPPHIQNVTRLTSYDGIVGEISTFVGTGARIGNAGDRSQPSHHHPMGNIVMRNVFISSQPDSLNWITGTSNTPQLNQTSIMMTRDSVRCAIMAAQVIWQDHMGAPPFNISAPPVKNLTVFNTGTNIDFDIHNRENNPVPSPPHEGEVNRPYVDLGWNGGLERLSGSLDSPVYGNDMQVDIVNQNGGFPQWHRENIVTVRMPMWEIRWAFDEATLLAGGGNKINWIRQTTGNQFGAETPRPFGGPFPVQHPGSRSWIPVSHGSDEPIEIFFTVVSYALLDAFEWTTFLGNKNNGNWHGGKMILKPFNPNRQFAPGTIGFPLPNINPKPYPRSTLDNRFRRDNDFLNIKDPFPEEIVVVSVLMPADPEA